MERIKEYFLANVIIITVVGASVLAVLYPGGGNSLDEFHLISPLIVIVFLCQGTGVHKMKTSHFKDYSKALIAGFFISQALAPVLGFACVKLLGWDKDSMVGFMLICCMAPTLVSGTVISGQAGGSQTASLLLTIVINIIAVFTVPLNLSWTLGESVSVEIMPLLQKLVILVLIPAIAGHLFRLKYGAFRESHKVWFKYIPIACLGLVIYISMCRQAEALKELTLQMILNYTLASVAVHLILLYAAYYLAKTIKTGEDSAKSVAICCSQKTIPIAVAIWTSTFSSYALALLPAIVFHLCQIYCDGIIAKKWSRSNK